MKITKYEHACFVVEQDGKKLVVDPGAYTTDLFVPSDIVGIVITHEHADHMDKSHLQAITASNPDAIIYAHQDIVAQLGEFKTQAVVAGEGIKADNFELEFFGGKHATIYADIPVIANLGVMINGRIYYPGDSFTLPERDVEVLALPVSAPWMKLSEAIDFARAVKPGMIFPTHDAILSDVGKGLPDRLVPSLLDGTIKYQRLSEPLDI